MAAAACSTAPAGPPTKSAILVASDDPDRFLILTLDCTSTSDVCAHGSMRSTPARPSTLAPR